MEFIVSVLYMMGQVFWEAFTSPIVLGLYFLLFILVVWQYKRMEKTSRDIVGIKSNLYLKSAIISTVFGLIGGLFGSILLVFVGIDLYSIGILYLWLIAILLLLINPRYLCFAYAGGILALANLVFGYPDISIPHLMGLIAILHMVESVLILLNGPLNSVPVYIKLDGQIRGGFNLQKFWPLPLIALVGAGVADPGTGMSMPDWWPLLQDLDKFADDKLYLLVPVLAILGYGEVSTTDSPEDRSKKTALHLFLYSLALLALALLAAKFTMFILIVALFSPLGHEIVIWLGMREEKSKRPKYVRPSEGVGVLMVEANTMASRLGIKSGDVIISLNGIKVEGNSDLQSVANRDISLDFLVKREGEFIKFSGFRHVGEEVGLIFMPDDMTRRYLLLRQGRKKKK